jgi:hypothetical protein
MSEVVSRRIAQPSPGLIVLSGAKSVAKPSSIRKELLIQIGLLIYAAFIVLPLSFMLQALNEGRFMTMRVGFAFSIFAVAFVAGWIGVRYIVRNAPQQPKKKKGRQ